jgi:hypothetical protein
MASFPTQTNVMSMQQQQPQMQMQTGQTGGLQAPQLTNPFRQSMLMSQQTGMSGNSSPSSFMSPPATANPALNRQSTNPFARAQSQSPPAFGAQPFQQPQQPPQPQQPQQLQQPTGGAPAPLMPAQTGTNPFARNTMASPPVDQQRPQTAGAGLVPQPTGSTNPFRQGAFVNHTTGMGWQHNQAPIGGGLDQLPTMPVFPRPAQQTPWQQ